VHAVKVEIEVMSVGNLPAVDSTVATVGFVNSG